MILQLEHLNEKNAFSVDKKELLLLPQSLSSSSVFTIGRKTDCDITFPSDKSISRKHCELVHHSSGVLSLVDLKSSFGTLINGVQCPPNKEMTLKDNDRIKFGNEFTNIRLRRFRFCATRLEKKEKERLKEICRAIGGEMVKSIEAATHLLCNRYSATVKILHAIVFGKPIVNFDFAERLIAYYASGEGAAIFNEKGVAIVAPPAEDKFRPLDSTSIASIEDVSLPRHNLFKHHTIILLESGDEQYANILAHCGARVINLTSLSSTATASMLMDKVNKELNKHDADPNSQCSIFYEDSKSPSAKTIRLSQKSGFEFINTGALAISILENTPPKLLPADTLSQRALSQHQSSQQYSQADVGISSMQPAPSYEPKKIFSRRKDDAHSNYKASTISKSESSSSSVIRSTTLVSTQNVPETKIVEVKTEVEEVNKAQSDAPELHKGDSRPNDTGKMSKVSNRQALTTEAVNLVEVKLEEKKNPHDLQKMKSKPTEMLDDKNSDSQLHNDHDPQPHASIDKASKTPVKRKRLQQAENEDISCDTYSPDRKKKPIAEKKRSEAMAKSLMPSKQPSAAVLVDKNGWVSGHGSTMHQEAEPHVESYKAASQSSAVIESKLEDEDDDIPVEYPQAVSVEVCFSLRDLGPLKEGAVPGRNSRDRKCFVKNFVRGCYEAQNGSEGKKRLIGNRTALISLAQMEKLLPKESEREIQLQRAYEEEQKKLAQSEELFSDRVERGKGKRKLFG